MKSKKFSYAIMIITLFTLSCKKDQTIVAVPESASTLSVTKVISSHVNSATGFNNPSHPESITKYDFGFSFKYPITLIYNNSEKVNITSIEKLAAIVASINSTKFITSIVFPFNIIRNNVTTTIKNENDFIILINSHDTDNDGKPNYTDDDDDNDGATDSQEDLNKDGDPSNDDTDKDGKANYQDTDSDNDNQLDQDEDNDGDGDFTNDDSDKDGEYDYSDVDSDNDGVDDGEDSDDDNDGTDDSTEHHDDEDGEDGDSDDDNN